MEKKFHLRVRAVIRDGGKVLAVRTKGRDYCFLPGGHYENGETLANALKREIKEEMGLDAEVKQYLGIVEQGWQSGNTYNYEINHMFEIGIPDINVEANSRASEDDLEFFWIAPEDFEKYNLKPQIIWQPITEWLGGDNKIWQICKIE